MFVARLNADHVGFDPDLQKVGLLALSVVELAVAHAAARAHALDIAGRNAFDIAHAVLVGQIARQDIADDLHVAVAVGAETGAGLDALRQMPLLDPDLVTLDVDMPNLDGLACLDRIMQEWPRPVVMLSAGGSDGGADATLRALDRGAVEFVRKPSGAISLDLELVRDQLLEALRAAASVTLLGVPGPTRTRVSLSSRESMGVSLGGGAKLVGPV